MVRSPQALRALLDAIMAGLSWADAMASIGAQEGAGWTWKHKSREAERANDTSSDFYLDWPAGSEKRWLHDLLGIARMRRGVMLATLRRIGETGKIVDGRLVFEQDDFGGIALDDYGVPIAEHTIITEPTPGRHALRKAAIAARERRRELAPSSYSGNKPKPKDQAPFPPANSMLQELHAKAPLTTKPMTPLRRDLMDRLSAARANPNRESARPSMPVQILGRGDDDRRPENISRPSDQSGLPTRLPEARHTLPQPKPTAVDYSRHTRPVRIDAPGRG